MAVQCGCEWQIRMLGNQDNAQGKRMEELLGDVLVGKMLAQEKHSDRRGHFAMTALHLLELPCWKEQSAERSSNHRIPSD